MPPPWVLLVAVPLAFLACGVSAASDRPKIGDYINIDAVNSSKEIERLVSGHFAGRPSARAGAGGAGARLCSDTSPLAPCPGD